MKKPGKRKQVGSGSIRRRLVVLMGVFALLVQALLPVAVAVSTPSLADDDGMAEFHVVCTPYGIKVLPADDFDSGDRLASLACPFCQISQPATPVPDSVAEILAPIVAPAAMPTLLAETVTVFPRTVESLPRAPPASV